MCIKLSKFFYALLIIYNGWFEYIFFQRSNIMLILGAGMMCLIFIHALPNKNLGNSFTTELKIWTLFALTSFVFGILVAVNQGYVISSVLKFSQFLVLMYAIIYISDQDTNIDFFIKMFIVLAVLCAITTVFWGVDYSGNGRISMGTSNPNALGITMAIGVCCILYKHSFKKLISSILAFSAIFLLIYVSLLTGSRKTFLSIVFVIIYWFVFVVSKDIKSFQFSTKIKGMLTVLLVIGTGYYVLYSYFKDSVLLLRLSDLFKSGAVDREDMYHIAFDLFKQSPLVGIGLDNYRAVSTYGTYSHSTYAEALACTGILGCILYFSPYIVIISHYWKLVTSNLDALVLRQAKVLFGLFGVLLFLGVGIIHFYDIISSIAFGMIIAFNNVHMKINEDENI